MKAVVEPGDAAEAPDVRFEDMLRVAGQGREGAMRVAVAALLCAGARDPEERRQAAEELGAAVEGYVEISARARVLTQDMIGDGAMDSRLVIRAFLERIKALPRDGDISREAAIALVGIARAEVLPAVDRVVSVLQRHRTDEVETQMAQIARRAALMDRTVSDMERIGRTISLISINAAVEAARAGGESGRAFKVIAQEVRALATQSSDRLARLRRELSPGPEGKGHPSDPAGGAAARAPGKAVPRRAAPVPPTSAVRRDVPAESADAGPGGSGLSRPRAAPPP